MHGTKTRFTSGTTVLAHDFFKLFFEFTTKKNHVLLYLLTNLNFNGIFRI